MHLEVNLLIFLLISGEKEIGRQIVNMFLSQGSILRLLPCKMFGYFKLSDVSDLLEVKCVSFRILIMGPISM